MFDAYDDEGREVFGNLYTRQSSQEIGAVHDEVLAANRPTEISARRSLSLVPGTNRSWIVGEIQFAPSLSAPRRKTRPTGACYFEKKLILSAVAVIAGAFFAAPHLIQPSLAVGSSVTGKASVVDADTIEIQGE